jgi:hypothetical protein
MQEIIIIFFSGRITGWRYCANSIKLNLISRLKLPYFIFASIHTDDNGTDSEDIAAFINEIKLHDYKISKYSHSLPSHDVFLKQFSDSPMANLRWSSMFYHNCISFSLIEDFLTKNKQYIPNLVIKLRADMFFEDSVDLPSPIEKIIFILSGNHTGHYYFIPDNYFPDQFAAGTFKDMKIYCNVFNNMPVYFDKYGIELVTPEILLKKHMDLDNIQFSKIYCNYLLYKDRSKDCYS